MALLESFEEERLQIPDRHFEAMKREKVIYLLSKFIEITHSLIGDVYTDTHHNHTSSKGIR